MTKANSALVLGASGLVGSHLWRVGLERGIRVVGTRMVQPVQGLEPLDITDPVATGRLIRAVAPRWVFLAAANPNVEQCEAQPEITRRANVEAVQTVAELVSETGGTLVYYSSDYVFDGWAGPYSEEDPPNPISEYGRQKLEAEEIVRHELPTRHLVLRVTVVYGEESQGKNFVTRLVRTLGAGKSMRVPDDQIGSPTLVDDIAAASWDLTEAGAYGTFHLAGPDLMNRYDFACLAARVFGLDEGLLNPVSTAQLGQQAPRPLRAGMRSDRTERLLGYTFRRAEEGLSWVKQRVCK